MTAVLQALHRFAASGHPLDVHPEQVAGFLAYYQQLEQTSQAHGKAATEARNAIVEMVRAGSNPSTTSATANDAAWNTAVAIELEESRRALTLSLNVKQFRHLDSGELVHATRFTLEASEPELAKWAGGTSTPTGGMIIAEPSRSDTAWTATHGDWLTLTSLRSRETRVFSPTRFECAHEPVH